MLNLLAILHWGTKMFSLITMSVCWDSQKGGFTQRSIPREEASQSGTAVLVLLLVQFSLGPKSCFIFASSGFLWMYNFNLYLGSSFLMLIVIISITHFV